MRRLTKHLSWVSLNSQTDHTCIIKQFQNVYVVAAAQMYLAKVTSACWQNRNLGFLSTLSWSEKTSISSYALFEELERKPDSRTHKKQIYRCKETVLKIRILLKADQRKV